MRKFFNGLAGIFMSGLFLVVFLVSGFFANISAQMGVCLYGKGEVDYFSGVDFMGGTLICGKMPFYQDWQIMGLAGGLAAGLFFLLMLWLITVCSRTKPRDILEARFEFSLFSLGMAQVMYGFGRLVLLLTELTVMTPFSLSVLVLVLGLVAGAILYRKEKIFAIASPKTVKTKIVKQSDKVAIVRKKVLKNATTEVGSGPMTLVERIKKLYDEGKTEEVLKETEGLVEPLAEIYGLRAWAYYRQKEFEKAREEAQKAENNETALRCLAAIAAYHDKDSALMRHYTDQLPETPARDNAFIIYAREPSDTTSVTEILARALKWAAEPKDKTNTANVLNNTSRWFLAKGRNKENLVMALGFMQAALGLYGSKSTNLHHKASAWYWVSVIQEKLMDKSAAITAAEMSVKLWKRQLKADPVNQNYQKSLDGAKARLKELRKQ